MFWYVLAIQEWLVIPFWHFILVLNSGCIMLIYIHRHGDSALILLFCFVINVIYWRIWLLFVFFFKRISFSSSWNFGSNLKLISAWLRNPVLSVTCFMSFELYYVGIWFLFCLLFFACCFTSGWVMIDWGSSLHALNAIYFLWITWLLQLRTFNKLESMYANRILLLLTFFGYRSKINAYIAMCMCVSEFVCACLQSV